VARLLNGRVTLGARKIDAPVKAQPCARLGKRVMMRIVTLPQSGGLSKRPTLQSHQRKKVNVAVTVVVRMPFVRQIRVGVTIPKPDIIT
jgi:hypothetical protein